MVTIAGLLLAAAFLDQAPRTITGALGVRLGEVVADAELERRGFTGGPGRLLWEKRGRGHFQVERIGRSPSGHVVTIVLERTWAEAAGEHACRDEQAGLSELVAAAWASLDRATVGPPDIRFVTFREPGERRAARRIDIACSHIAGRMPPTLRVAWRVSGDERTMLYAGASGPGSE